MYDYLEESEYNRLIDERGPEIYDNVMAQDYETPEAIDRKICQELIAMLLDEGYSLMAITEMGMRYQIRIGKMMASAPVYVVKVPGVSDFFREFEP